MGREPGKLNGPSEPGKSAGNSQQSHLVKGDSVREGGVKSMTAVTFTQTPNHRVIDHSREIKIYGMLL